MVISISVWGQHSITGYKKNGIIFQDRFDTGFNRQDWQTEIASVGTSAVYVNKNKLLLDTEGCVTVWLNKKLSGNLLIEYKRKILKDSGQNDRVSDLNQFWMATDPNNKCLFTRNGILEEYDCLSLYYAGMGGNHNITTRFRKYENGDRRLLKEYSDCPSPIAK